MAICAINTLINFVSRCILIFLGTHTYYNFNMVLRTGLMNDWDHSLKNWGLGYV